MDEIQPSKIPTEIVNAIALIDDVGKNLEDADPIALYQSVLLIDEASIKDTSFDDKSKKALHICLNKLNFANHGAIFLDAWKRYIRILLKYKQWQDANNFLIVYEAHHAGGHLPGWYLNALAKLQYEIDSTHSFTHPHSVLDSLSQSALQPDGLAQAKSIFKEFVLRAREYFQENNIDSGQFVESVNRFVKTLDDNLQSQWPDTNYLHVTSDQNQIPHQIGVSNNLEELHSKIYDLERRLEEYEEHFDKMTTELAGLYFKIADLKQANTKRSGEAQTTRNLKILILGASEVKPNDIFGIARRHGLGKESLELCLDYKKNKRFNLEKIRWTSPYSGVLIGPIAHKVIGVGNHSSAIQLLKEEGFPPACGIRTSSGTLKITKTTLSAAFEEVLDMIRSIDPEILPNTI